MCPEWRTFAIFVWTLTKVKRTFIFVVLSAQKCQKYFDITQKWYARAQAYTPPLYCENECIVRLTGYRFIAIFSCDNKDFIANLCSNASSKLTISVLHLSSDLWFDERMWPMCAPCLCVFMHVESINFDILHPFIHLPLECVEMLTILLSRNCLCKLNARSSKPNKMYTWTGVDIDMEAWCTKKESSK